jgi:hypothetical protein
MSTKKWQVEQQIRALEANMPPRNPAWNHVVDSPMALATLLASGHRGGFIVDPMFAMTPAQRRIEQQIRALERT